MEDGRYTANDALTLLTHMHLSMEEKEKEQFRRLWPDFCGHFYDIHRDQVKSLISALSELYVRVLPFYSYSDDPAELMLRRSELRDALFTERLEKGDIEGRLSLGETLEDLVKSR